MSIEPMQRYTVQCTQYVYVHICLAFVNIHAVYLTQKPDKCRCSDCNRFGFYGGIQIIFGTVWLYLVKFR